MNARQAVGVALMLLLAFPAQAAMYKWVDRDGNVIYSELPPPDAKDVKAIAPPPRVPEAVPAPVAPAAQPAQDVQKDQANAKQIARFEEARRKNCEAAKRNLETYRIARRIRTADQELIVLDDATRAARIEQAEKDVATYCK